MTESRKSKNLAPLPTPELHPEKPMPNIPIPGTPTIGGEKERRFTCEVCGKVFKSSEELKAHMKKAHGL